jgi:hypothetical protein
MHLRLLPPNFYRHCQIVSPFIIHAVVLAVFDRQAVQRKAAVVDGPRETCVVPSKASSALLDLDLYRLDGAPQDF